MSALTAVTPAGADRRSLLAELRRREPTLALLGLGLWAAILPAALAGLLDPRTLDGVSVWLKPIKFMASVGCFTLTAAWFIGYLPEARRRAPPVRIVVWTMVATGLFEVAYITLQGALGERSHFNVGDPLHAALFTLMGIGAVLLTLTPLLLAWELRRHGMAGLAPAYRRAVLLGLTLTAVLGIVSGAAISVNGGYIVGGAYGGEGLPLFGWSYVVGDLRVAHFVALHAEQLLPLLALTLMAVRPRRARAGVTAGAVMLAALFGALLAQAMAGQPFLSL